MQIKLNNSLLYATLEITYNGKSKILEDIIVDTGAAHSIICPDIVEDLGIEDSPEDELITMYGVGGIQYAYRKKIESIKFGSCLVSGYKLDFGYIDENGRINGLLGLDLLMEMGLVLDLKNLIIYPCK
jgi:predicted aspartyl protease